MLTLNENINLICRLCLCKCENPKNMLVDTEFATKVMEVFQKIQISPENNLSNLVCDYCHNLILQFYGYFEAVNANQDELLKIVSEPLLKETIEIPLLEIEVGDDKKILDSKEVMEMDSNVYIEELPLESKLEQEVVQNSTKQQKKQKPAKKCIKTYTKQELFKLTSAELRNLPINFTSSFLCPLCPVPTCFKIKCLLKKHIFTVHLKKTSPSSKLAKTEFYTRSLESQCNICPQRKGKLHKGKQPYNDHKFVHYGIKPYKCDVCMFTSYTKENLRRHILRHIYRLRGIGCLYCKENFISNHLQEQHIRETHKDKLYECELCGYKLTSRKSAVEHMQFHKEDAKLTFECERCVGGIRFPNSHILELHRKQHILEDKSRKSLACRLCERKFHQEKALKLHLNYHAAGKIVACPECGKSETVFTRRRLSQHKRYHLQQEKKIPKCDKCDLEFPDRVLLIRHKRSVHEKNEQSCYKCGKLVVGYLMTRHLQLCNAGDFPCMHCNMVFKKESERRRHNRKEHVGIRCFRCNKEFETPAALALHQKYDPDHLKTKKTKPRKTKKNL